MSKVFLRSWGLPGPYEHEVVQLDRYTNGRLEPQLLDTPQSLLAIGNGRSYGDVGLNCGEGAVLAREWDRLIEFDAERGLVTCDSGVTLDRLITTYMPYGWFPAVVPGTRFVTIGGAIANDVHGKNHHRCGSFGDHVEWIDLWRTDRGMIRCSEDAHSDLFRATIGGLGLTGIIVRACLRLRPVNTGYMRVVTTRFATIDEFQALDTDAEAKHEYTVAWLDCLSHGGKIGRGIFYAGDHLQEISPGKIRWPEVPAPKSVPITPPVPLVNRASLAVFNQLYWWRGKEGTSEQSIHPYFFPLDSVLSWNRIYGRSGFYQFQCVLPSSAGADGISAILDIIARSGQGSFLAVLKKFGMRPTPGLLSFPRAGITLALDFPNLGQTTHRLCSALNRIVADSGGALYPAKDALMPAALFQSAYPAWRQLEALRDPRLNSTFWRRVTAPV
nr:FAD-binding oxidoreductase [uncultured Cupriavidus sp.]